jgi:hypothetical protein
LLTQAELLNNVARLQIARDPAISARVHHFVGESIWLHDFDFPWCRLTGAGDLDGVKITTEHYNQAKYRDTLVTAQ